MNLRGQSESGYAMAALLVGLSIMAVMLSVAMPVWRHAAQREKEEELVFRGEQYARAIRLFQQRYAATPPPSVDVLVQERFLRKKFKDPITNQDFVPITAAQAAAPSAVQVGGRGGLAPPARGAAPAQPGLPGQPLTPQGRGGGGIVGVTSASTDLSIRLYNGANRYNQWRFVAVAATATPGAGARGVAVPGQRGQPPGRGGVQPFPPGGRGAGAPGAGLPLRGGAGGPPTLPAAPGRGRQP